MFGFSFKSLAAGLVLAVGLGTGPAGADSFPEKPISLIIPFGAGGSHDLNARVFTSVIPEHLGQAVVVRLMPGGGGQIGTAAAAEARPDGYTLLFTHNFTDQLQQHVANLPYKPNEDFVTVAMLNSVAPVVVVRADSPFQTIAELVEYAKANPGKLTLGHGGTWGSLMVAGVMMLNEIGIEATLVPFTGGGPTMQALLAGDIDVTMSYLSIVGAQGDAVRVLASYSQERLRDDVPTLTELGYDVNPLAATMYRIVLAPAGISEDRLTKLREAFVKMQEDRSYQLLMSRIEEQTDFIPGAEYEALRARQHDIYGDLAKRMVGR